VSELKLDGKVALVTGAATGIGEGIVRKLAQRGAKVVVNGNYRPSGQGPEVDVAEDIRAQGGEAVSVNGAVHDKAAARAIVAKAIEAFGRLDIVVNNAGTAAGPLVPHGPDEAFNEQIAVHVHGTMWIVQEAWPHLARAGNGRILNVGSAASFGFHGADGWNSAYPAAKAALYGLTRQMAGAGAEVGIKVNLLLPRAITPLKLRRIAGSELLRWQAKHLEMEPLAASVVYMVHEDFPATGQFFSSAGGRVARVVWASSDGYTQAYARRRERSLGRGVGSAGQRRLHQQLLRVARSGQRAPAPRQAPCRARQVA
jgi:NAD(P)-dependent dehydrogenase (short-subunit alcohol dehydrogenase family)